MAAKRKNGARKKSTNSTGPMCAIALNLLLYSGLPANKAYTRVQPCSRHRTTAAAMAAAQALQVNSFVHNVKSSPFALPCYLQAGIMGDESGGKEQNCNWAVTYYILH